VGPFAAVLDIKIVERRTFSSRVTARGMDTVPYLGAGIAIIRRAATAKRPDTS
jgi:hypothetical protein